jgi:hypothetical protein
MLKKLFPYPKKNPAREHGRTCRPIKRHAHKKIFAPNLMRRLFSVCLLLLFGEGSDSKSKCSTQEQNYSSPERTLVATKNHYMTELVGNTSSVPQAPNSK